TEERILVGDIAVT
ncbi:unnamed protein product, partial [Allacma fusca]